MSYTRYRTLWVNLPSQTTAANATFLQKIEDTFVSQDSRITTLETTGGGTGVASVVAGDSTILVAGTAANPTIKVNNIPESDVTNLIVDLANKASLTSGKVPTSQLGTGTADSTAFLRGDQTWTVLAGGGGSVPLTTKGDLLGVDGTGTLIRVPVTTNQLWVLKSTTSQASGWGWSKDSNSIVKNQGGTALPSQDTLNFTGSGVTAQNNPVTNTTDIIISGGSGYNQVYSNGGPLPTRNWLNFKGSGVTLSDNDGGNSATNITIAGAGGLNIGSAFSLTTTSGANSIAIVQPGTNARIIIGSSDSVVAIIDPLILGPSLDNPYITYVVVEQDAIGGHFWQMNPMTIVWENGYGPTTQYSPWDLSPGSITFIRLEWMGSKYGWMGKLLNSIPPLTTPLPSTWNNSLANKSIPSNPITQNLNLGANAYSMRYCSVTDIKVVMDALTQFFSPALRQRLANSGKLYVEVNHRFPTGGIYGNYGRGFYDQYGGYNSGIDAAHYLNTVSVWRNDTDPVTGLGSDAGIVCHETCHAISGLYYGGGANGGANPNEIGLASTNILSQHPPILAIQNEAIAAGGGPTSFSDEWFAEVESGRRKSLNSQQLAQMGTASSGGRTPQQRVDAYNSLMATLPGMQL